MATNISTHISTNSEPQKTTKKSSKNFGLHIPLCLGIFLFGLAIGGLFVSKGLKPKSGQPNIADASAAAYLKFKQIKAEFAPTGAPAMYGAELDISFDEVQDAIDKVAPFDPTYGAEGKKIALSDFTPAELARYVKIGSSIACEYCCGVKTMVFENGEAACGCDHSQMMRGLTAYLIKKHPEAPDEWILEELTKWKKTYFPKQTLTAELDKRAKAGETGLKEIMSEFPDLMPQMVGGC